VQPGEARSRLIQLDPKAGDHVDLANPRRVVRALEIAAVAGSTPSQRAATAEAVAIREYRPLLDFVAVGFDPGDELAERVERRFDAMLDAGLLDEVAGLHGQLGRLSAQAVGYKELLPVVSGEVTIATGRAAAVQATRALAKRQRTYFRRDPRIHWLPWRPKPAQRAELAADYLDGQL
jgi:tRNA dimethylallyltransferase